jgi:hypothetical protein
MMMHDVTMTRKIKEQAILILGIFPGRYIYFELVSSPGDVAIF